MPTDSFAYVSNAKFTEEPGGYLKLRLFGECHIPYPEGYGFPISEGGTARILAGSYLKPFVTIDAVDENLFKPACPDIEARAEKKLRGHFAPGYLFSAGTSPDTVARSNSRVTIFASAAPNVRSGTRCFQTVPFGYFSSRSSLDRENVSLVLRRSPNTRTGDGRC